MKESSTPAAKNIQERLDGALLRMDQERARACADYDAAKKDQQAHYWESASAAVRAEDAMNREQGTLRGALAGGSVKDLDGSIDRYVAAKDRKRDAETSRRSLYGAISGDTPVGKPLGTEVEKPDPQLL